MFKIAVLVSGSGTNLQSIIDKIKLNNFASNIKLEAVIADRECYGVERAKKENIDAFMFDRKKYKEDLFKEIDKILSEKKVDLIVLAGFLSILPKDFVTKWKRKIINIHPSLLPKFGGKGMYGLNVHKKVIEEKEKISGCTVHYVDNGVDSGQIIKQRKVKVLDGDTPLDLQKRVLVEEHILLVESIEMLAKKYGGKI